MRRFVVAAVAHVLLIVAWVGLMEAPVSSGAGSMVDLPLDTSSRGGGDWCC
jgi:hypothetical protein